MLDDTVTTPYFVNHADIARFSAEVLLDDNGWDLDGARGCAISNADTTSRIMCVSFLPQRVVKPQLVVCSTGHSYYSLVTCFRLDVTVRREGQLPRGLHLCRDSLVDASL